MENLEAKYFEKTISALQNAKKEEQYLMRNDFRDKLRVQLIEKAALISHESTFDWSEFVLRWKYAFGAVPVLAVLTIVAVNFSNRSIDLPKSDSLSENSLMLQQVQFSEENPENNSLNNDLVTFSAVGVMPPAELLERKNEQYDNVANSVEKESEIIFPIDQKVNDLTITNTEVTVFSYEIDKLVDAIDSYNLNKKVELINEPDVEKNHNTEVKDFPLEQFGRVEQNAQINMLIQDNVDSKSEGDLQGNIEMNAATEPLVENVLEQETESLDLSLNVNENYVDANLEINQSVSKSVMSSPDFALQVAPRYLEKSRVVFVDYPVEDGLLSYVMTIFSSYNGLLSDDYQIEVLKLEDGLVKATLYQFGKPEKIVFMEELKGGWTVVTEIVR